MTDARDRLARELEEAVHGRMSAWPDAQADAILAAIREEIGSGWAKRVVMNSNAIEAALKRLEAVERETRVLREATGVEMNRTEEGTRWWVKGQPVPESGGGLSGTHYDAPAATFICDDCGRRPTRIAFQLCDRCWERYERPV